jgi:hypothetical protein
MFNLIKKKLISKMRKPIDKFIKICIIGNLNIAQKIFELNNIKIIDINDFVFRIVCRKGNIDIAKWLYSMGGINIHTYDENAFADSCKYGHLNVAIWLNSIGIHEIHIHDNNHYAFKSCCKNGHIDIAEWLCSICPTYEMKVTENRIIPIIYTEKEYIIMLIQNNNIDKIKSMFKIKKNLIEFNLIEDVCPICLDIMNDTICVQLRCNHILHLNCFCKMKNNNCVYKCQKKNYFSLKNTLLV